MPDPSVVVSSPEGGLEKELNNIQVWMQEVSQKLAALGNKVDSFHNNVSGSSTNGSTSPRFGASNFPCAGMQASCGIGEVDMLDTLLQRHISAKDKPDSHVVMINIIEHLKLLEKGIHFRREEEKRLHHAVNKDLVAMLEEKVSRTIMTELKFLEKSVSRAVTLSVSQSLEHLKLLEKSISQAVCLSAGQSVHQSLSTNLVSASQQPKMVVEQLQRVEKCLTQLVNLNQKILSNTSDQQTFAVPSQPAIATVIGRAQPAQLASNAHSGMQLLPRDQLERLEQELNHLVNVQQNFVSSNGFAIGDLPAQSHTILPMGNAQNGGQPEWTQLARKEEMSRSLRPAGDITFIVLRDEIEEKAEAVKRHIDSYFGRAANVGGPHTSFGAPMGAEMSYNSHTSFGAPTGAEMSYKSVSQISECRQAGASWGQLRRDESKAPGMEKGDPYVEVEVKASSAMRAIFEGVSHAKLKKPPWNVEDYYYQHGFCQRYARSEWLHHLSFFIVILNCCYIAIAADSEVNVSSTSGLYSSGFHLGFMLSENAFTLYFVWELGIRYGAFQQKWAFWKDNWCRFDFVLVIEMVVENWIVAPIFYALDPDARGNLLPIEIFRVLRVLRLTERIPRLARAFPEFAIISKSLVAGARAVCSTLMFIFILTYVFAIALQALLSKQDKFNAELHPRNFVSIRHSMLTLILDGALMMDPEGVLLPMYTADWGLLTVGFVVFFFFILLSAITLMNMLIGSLCEVVDRKSVV